MEFHKCLDPIAAVQITEEADAVNVIVPKPVDIQKVDNALVRAMHAEPLDRFERPDSWRIRLLKRDQERSGEIRYQAVR